MRVVIAGGHGQVALRLERLLAVRGDEVAGLIRNPDHAGDLRAAGAEPVVCDLEAASVEEVAGHVSGADAVVFAAGAGPGSGAARKETVD
ncbi:NAD-dependent dehydratase, partial [Carbonactinospora thermoautotrophica]